MANKGSILKSGESLQAGDYLVSANGMFCAYLFEDGNLCIYSSPIPDSNTFMWASGPQVALGPKCAYLFEDGNLCIYNGLTPDSNAFVWASGPQVALGPKCACLHDDGNLCIYNSPTPDANTYVWGSAATVQATVQSYETEFNDPLQHSHILVRVSMKEENVLNEELPTLADLLNAAQVGGPAVNDAFHQLNNAVQQIQQNGEPWWKSSLVGISSVGTGGGLIYKGARKIFQQRDKARQTRATSEEAQRVLDEARARAAEARANATDARARQMAQEELGPGEEEVGQMEQGAVEAESAAAEAETAFTDSVAAVGEADAAVTAAETAADAAVMAEVSALSATGVGAVVVGIAVVAAAIAIAIAEHDEKQVHVVVNDSPYELRFNARRNLLNYHGKTIILPEVNETHSFTLPARTDDGHVSLAILGFQKMEDASFGCEGAYELFANPMVANGSAALPHGIKCFYYQPFSGNNGIGVNVASEANLNDFWAAYEEEDSRLVDVSQNGAVTVYAGLNSHSGGSGMAVIYIKG